MEKMKELHLRNETSLETPQKPVFPFPLNIHMQTVKCQTTSLQVLAEGRWYTEASYPASSDTININSY